MKNLKSLGKTLNKTEQKTIFGGAQIKKIPNCEIIYNPCPECSSDEDCPPNVVIGTHLTIGYYCTSGGHCQQVYI